MPTKKKTTSKSKTKTLNRLRGRRAVDRASRDTHFDAAVAHRFGVPVGPPGKSKARPGPATPRLTKTQRQSVTNKSVARNKASFDRLSSNIRGADKRERALTRGRKARVVGNKPKTKLPRKKR